MESTAKLSYLRQSPNKVKLVIDTVRGHKVSTALLKLSYLPKTSARAVFKLIKSAQANAEVKSQSKEGEWWIKTITVGQGPVLKRFTPRAQGRATPIRKPTCHINVVLSNEAPKKTPKN